MAAMAPQRGIKAIMWNTLQTELQTATEEGRKEWDAEDVAHHVRSLVVWLLYKQVCRSSAVIYTALKMASDGPGN